ncbi:winged helix-turn-helix domain-containing protein [Pyrolobus fumarii]|uniref:winged helix-turn-helix domain-containing protein n=1 Tax=Pyrolobus fumarii TaxID=54252 RepID=UPI000691AF65|nr:LysR family transcriptional regulator [Pyrolobus fumarii]
MPGVRVCARIFIECGGIRVAGRGLVEALEAIEREGSIRGAARALGINYRRLLSRIHRAERVLGVKLIDVTGSGSRLTEEARRLIRAFRELEALVGGKCVEAGFECND